LLKKHGIIELKTDKLDFYNYSLNSFDNFPKFKKNNSTLNLYENVILLKNNVQTEYEQKFTKQNIKIKKAKFERI
jgi:tRNA G46 methylase TrmB